MTKRTATTLVGINIREKRDMKAGAKLKSPFVKRIVDLNDTVEQKEVNIAQVIIALGMHKRELVWETKEGFGMNLDCARTIALKVKISSNVIDCWSVMLNKLEGSKVESSYSRMFLPTGLLSDSMLDEIVPENVRYNEFEGVMKAVIEDITDDAQLKHVDLLKECTT